MALLDLLRKMSERLDEIESSISDPDVIADHARYTALLKERGGLTARVAAYRAHRALERDLADARDLVESVSDAAEREAFAEEVERLEAEIAEAYEHLRETFVTEDEDAHRDVILEIRAGTGGDEAALFAGDLFRMYELFAERMGWEIEVLEVAPGAVGGYRELIANVTGEGVYKYLRYESGGHRVQRVPATESQGRVHTSAATVAVLPEASEVEVEIQEKDLRIDAFRSSGPGGQSVNKTSSAIRVTHVPSGLVVSCQDEKSQHKNRAKALKILASRLYDLERARVHAERSSSRKAQIGSGDRSERIRTYNFPQNRISDHRIGLSLYNLDRAMQGELEPVIEPLMNHDRELRLQALEQ
ncbi:MAG: peptide chain release factor 1 [Planctomycetota bacterium]